MVSRTSIWTICSLYSGATMVEFVHSVQFEPSFIFVHDHSDPSIESICLHTVTYIVVA